MTKMLFSELDLNQEILSAVRKKGLVELTPIQEKTIAPILKGADLLGVAQTGTGKTVAFSLPILHKIKSTKFKIKPARVRTLVLCPTRELAEQVGTNMRVFGAGLNLKTNIIYGGIAKKKQEKNIIKGSDILVATPGRLIDFVKSEQLFFDQLDSLIIDEADQMLHLGFIKDIRKILSYLPSERQTLFFSATMPDEIKILAKEILNDPVTVKVSKEEKIQLKINETLSFVEKIHKPNLLKSLLRSKKLKKVLVFVRTKKGADRLGEHLKSEKINSGVIHGDKSQGERDHWLRTFKKGKTRVLVATDVAARGIDVKDISHVINYDVPTDPENYIHRIGRTGRAGKEGIAITFCDKTEVRLIENIEKKIGRKIDRNENES